MDGMTLQEPGPDPRQEGTAQPLYRALREARSTARAAERRAEMGADDDPLNLRPEWAEVKRIASEILESHAADAEVLAWLIEAETRLAGHAGLARAAAWGGHLVRRFGTSMHPRPEEPEDDAFSALAGLNGVGREGTLIGPLRLVPLVPGSAWGEASLWAVQSEGAAILSEAARQAGPEAMAATLSEIEAADAAIAALDADLTELRGAEAPSFGAIREVLDATMRAMRNTGLLADTAPPPALPDEEITGSDDGSGAAATRPVRSREDAFEQLLRIAAWFRTAEPHSPIAASIETLVRRGRMDFSQLLEELIPDDHTRAGVLSSAGIKPPPET